MSENTQNQSIAEQLKNEWKSKWAGYTINICIALLVPLLYVLYRVTSIVSLMAGRFISSVGDIQYEKASDFMFWGSANTYWSLAMSIPFIVWFLLPMNDTNSSKKSRKLAVNCALLTMAFYAALQIPSTIIVKNFNKQITILSVTESPQTINRLKAEFVQMKSRADFERIDAEIRGLLSGIKTERPEFNGGNQ